ncbi:MAG: hypothetical protein ACREEM_23585 [Blastocatellia bacterium]
MRKYADPARLGRALRHVYVLAGRKEEAEQLYAEWEQWTHSQPFQLDWIDIYAMHALGA